MKSKFLWIAAGLLLTAQAHANNDDSCGPWAASGKWVMYQAAVSDGFQHTGRCELKIKDGTANGQCVMSNGLDVAVTGPVTVNKNCSATIVLGFHVPNGGPHIDSEFNVQLTRDREAFAGQFINTFGVVGLSNGVRR
jgi:hypothetical protein